MTTLIPKVDLMNGENTPTGAINRPINQKLQEMASIQDFGADPTGVADSTAAIIAAYNSVKNPSPEYPKRALYFPPGFYSVSTIELNDVLDFNFVSDNAVLVANSSAAHDAVFKITNCFNVVFSGELEINVAGKSNYGAGFYLTTASGGTIAPTGGLITRIEINNMRIADAQLALQIGEYNNDGNTAQIDFVNFQSIRCPQVLHAGGSQVVCHFIGGTLGSEPSALFPGVDEYAIRAEGSAVTVTGGEITLTNDSTNKTIWMNPAQSSLYGNPYGSIRINGCHVEDASVLCFISNPRSLSTPSSWASQFQIQGCGGYVSPGLDSGNYIEIDDSTYSGRIQIANCNFYVDVTHTRSAYNVYSASSTALIQCDKTSLGQGFLNWMGGVDGGILISDLEQIVYADSLYGQSFASGDNKNLVFVAQTTSDQFNRNKTAYNTSTGTFTVPAGDFKTLQISVNCSCVSGTPAGTIQILQNGNPDAQGWIYGNSMGINAEYYNIPAGTTFSVVFHNTSGGTVLFGSSSADKIVISASN